MSGLQGPSDAELAKRLEKRLYQAKYDKRFNRNGVKPISVSGDGNIKGADRLGSSHHGDGSTNTLSDG